MCMTDDGETYSVYHEREVRARKAHDCNECGRVIAVGETYRHTSGLYEDSWNINKVCAHCTIAAKWLMENCHGYLDGMIEEDIEQHFDEYARVDLARLKVGMRRNWQRFKGVGLMPIPKLPRPIKLGDAR